jgi:hypothetical protein
VHRQARHNGIGGVPTMQYSQVFKETDKIIYCASWNTTGSRAGGAAPRKDVNRIILTPEKGVPIENSLQFAGALQKRKIPLDLHI